MGLGNIVSLPDFRNTNLCLSRVIPNIVVEWLVVLLVFRIYLMMDKVQKAINSEYYAPSSEPFRSNALSASAPRPGALAEVFPP